MTLDDIIMAAEATLSLARYHKIDYYATTKYAQLRMIVQRLKEEPETPTGEAARSLGFIQGMVFILADDAVTLDDLNAINQRGSR